MSQLNTRADKILILDDDARIRDLLRRYLTQEGFEVILAEDSKALNRIMMRDAVDLIVLDLMMPGEDGLSICRRLRAANDRTPIIMLTAKGEDVDRIVGLEVGADDYLAKPFNPRELLARIHAVLRRRPAVEVPGAPSSDQELVKFGPFSFDMGLRTLHKNGEELPLTTGEFAMLKTLVRHPRQPLSREKLAQIVGKLRAVHERPANFGCYGMHEWAMVYGGHDVRHTVTGAQRLKRAVPGMKPVRRACGASSAEGWSCHCRSRWHVGVERR